MIDIGQRNSPQTNRLLLVIVELDQSELLFGFNIRVLHFFVFRLYVYAFGPSIVCLPLGCPAVPRCSFPQCIFQSNISSGVGSHFPDHVFPLQPGTRSPFSPRPRHDPDIATDPPSLPDVWPGALQASVGDLGVPSHPDTRPSVTHLAQKPFAMYQRSPEVPPSVSAATAAAAASTARAPVVDRCSSPSPAACCAALPGEGKIKTPTGCDLVRVRCVRALCMCERVRV